MITRNTLRYVVASILLILLLAACRAERPTEEIPTMDAGIGMTSTETLEPAKQEATGIWDLVIISDRSGWGVADIYAEYLEIDLGVDVTVHHFALGGLSAGSMLSYFRDPEGSLFDPRLSEKGLAGIIPQAEIIIFNPNPLTSGTGSNDCHQSPPYASVECTADTYDQYQTDLEALYEEMISRWGNSPIIIRAFDEYAPFIDAWRENEVFDACMYCWQKSNEARIQAAAAYGVPIARVFDAFNGLDHDEDAAAKGYIENNTAGYLTTQEGARLIADLLRQLGYDPIVRQ